jgi:hypothetical protein
MRRRKSEKLFDCLDSSKNLGIHIETFRKLMTLGVLSQGRIQSVRVGSAETASS